MHSTRSDFLQVRDNGACGRHEMAVGRKLESESVDSSRAIYSPQGFLTDVRLEPPWFAAGHQPRPLGQVRRRRFHQQFGRLYTVQLVSQGTRVALPDFHLAGGQIRRGQSNRVLTGDRDDERVPPQIEERIVDHGSRRDDLHDFPPYESFGLRGILDLLADRHLPSQADQPGEVLGQCLHRHSSQWHIRRAVVARSKRDAEQSASFLRVIEEHLVEVTDPEEQDRIGVPRLDVEILLDQRRMRRGAGHGSSDTTIASNPSERSRTASRAASSLRVNCPTRTR